MRGFIFFTFTVLLSILSTNNIFAQVTIGSSEPPMKGALLDLKQNSDGTSSKGLALPRVELISNKTLTVASGGAAEANHIGMIVYNTKTIETSKEEILCPGVHTWNGTRWIPMIPYPKYDTSVQPLAGPTPDLTDSRDGETYHTARFHSVKTTYSCKTGTNHTIVDAGIWMTQNLRYTGSLTNSPADNYVRMQYYTPSNTGANTARIRENGKLYNWAAASSQKGNTTTGDGNADNPPTYVSNEEGYGKPDAAKEIRRQGICPDGWHLPTHTEFYELKDALILRPDLYSSQTTASQANVGNIMKSTLSGSGTYQGTSKTADKGGFAGLLTGFANQDRVTGYGVSGFWWTSSSKMTVNSYKQRVDNSTTGVDNNSSSRNNHFAVRCKKDDIN